MDNLFVQMLHQLPRTFLVYELDQFRFAEGFYYTMLPYQDKLNNIEFMVRYFELLPKAQEFARKLRRKRLRSLMQ